MNHHDALRNCHYRLLDIAEGVAMLHPALAEHLALIAEDILHHSESIKSSVTVITIQHP